MRVEGLQIILERKNSYIYLRVLFIFYIESNKDYICKIKVK
jgi:hypothetical protein